MNPHFHNQHMIPFVIISLCPRVKRHVSPLPTNETATSMNPRPEKAGSGVAAEVVMIQYPQPRSCVHHRSGVMVRLVLHSPTASAVSSYVKEQPILVAPT